MHGTRDGQFSIASSSSPTTQLPKAGAATLTAIAYDAAGTALLTTSVDISVAEPQVATATAGSTSTSSTTSPADFVPQTVARPSE